MKQHIRRSAGTLLLVLLAVTLAAAQGQPATQLAPAPPQPSAEEVSAIQKVMQTQDPTQRLALAEDFLTKYPESPLRSRAYAAAAEAYQAQNNFAKAVEYGEKALELSPQDAFSMLLVAESLAAGAVPTQLDYQDKLNKAETYVRQALEILPQLFAAMPHRPEVPAEQYKLEEDYVTSQAHGILGYIYLRRTQYAQAEEELKLATEMNRKRPYDVDFLRLGTAYKRQKEYSEAEAAFKRCVEISGSAGAACQKEMESVQRLQKAQQPPAEEKKP